MGNSLKDQHYKNMDIRLQMDTSTFQAEMVVCGTTVHSAVFPWKEVCIWFAKAVEFLHINRQSFH